ncbi:uncharacterized protein MELLADRAFT_124520 [Melampsora larici-populina 98AG31]|uniref:Secreted protein n=1 Tax=Melampsora larici-populina (strain 98AG31 / pathotype 3-4-7) TaxID=747676 RepID=F4S7C2_MELLP|nr:uncharacterized protein MELLADRAFT_124520 [Melampsora larici-populina 98AG31]EGF99496.1 secreted protein [Melampsora larici-populina 98AG31]
MNFSIVAAMLMISVSINQASGAIINLKDEKEIVSAQQAVTKHIDGTIDEGPEVTCVWCQDTKGVCWCGPPLKPPKST